MTMSEIQKALTIKRPLSEYSDTQLSHCIKHSAWISRQLEEVFDSICDYQWQLVQEQDRRSCANKKEMSVYWKNQLYGD